MARARIALLGMAWLALVTFPFWIGNRPYLVTVINQVAIFALWAIAYNLLYGYLGEISFGHAAFFGLGAYAVPLAMTHLGAPVGVAMLLGVLLAGVWEALISVVLRQAHGVFYAIMTFTFAQVVYFVVLKWTAFTGGDDGMMVTRPPWLTRPEHYFVFSVLAASVGAALLWRIVNSPGGRVVVAIAQNERRARQLGYNTGVYRALAFVISGMFSGLAGTMFSQLIFFVSPNVLHWTFSGEVVIMTIVGGAGAFLGPVLGAAFFVIVQEYVSSLTASSLTVGPFALSRLGERWPLVMGFLFFLVIVFEPDGLFGLVRRLAGRPAFLVSRGKTPVGEIEILNSENPHGGRS